VELSDRKNWVGLSVKKMQIVYKVICMSLMTDFSALSFVANETNILAVPEVCELY